MRLLGMVAVMVFFDDDDEVGSDKRSRQWMEIDHLYLIRQTCDLFHTNSLLILRTLEKVITYCVQLRVNHSRSPFQS